MSFWLDKRVLITGHTGFKGSWLTLALLESGANISGFALEAEQVSLFNQLSNIGKIDSCIGDIRDRKKLTKEFDTKNIQYGFHYPSALHQLKSLRKFFLNEKYPNAQKIANEGLSLPINPLLKKKEIKKICKVINSF